MPKSENKFKGPTFHYGPNGEAEVFHHSDDVPEGWLDDPAKHAKPAEAAKDAPKDAPLSMTKKEILAALEAGGVQFNPRDSAKALHDLLVEKVKSVLTEAEIAFDPASDAKTLLGLLPPTE